MRNCRCFFFSSSASCTQRLRLRFSALSPFFSLTTPLPATSHSQSQPQSCRLAWLSARVESFSVNGQPTPLPLLLLPSPLPATPADPFYCALPALCSSPSTCCFALSVVAVAFAVVIVAVCFRPFFFSYASHAAPCPYFFFVRQATTRASVTVTAASASVAATSSDHCSAEHAMHSGTLTLKTDH